MRSRDGGATWTPVPGVREAQAIGFGQGGSGQGGSGQGGAGPSLLVAGWVKGQYGIWRSRDDGAAWERLGEFPLGLLSSVGALMGDADGSDRVYLGFRGAGYALFDKDKPAP